MPPGQILVSRENIHNWVRHFFFSLPLPKLQFIFHVIFDAKGWEWVANRDVGYGARGQPVEYIWNCLFRLYSAAVIIAFKNSDIFATISAHEIFAFVSTLHTHLIHCVRFPPYFRILRGRFQILMFDTIQWFHSIEREFFPFSFVATSISTLARRALPEFILFYYTFSRHFSMVVPITVRAHPSCVWFDLWVSVCATEAFHLSIFNHQMFNFTNTNKGAGMSWMPVKWFECHLAARESHQNYLPEMMLYHLKWNPQRCD